jgi:hypothetical protein
MRLTLILLVVLAPLFITSAQWGPAQLQVGSVISGKSDRKTGRLLRRILVGLTEAGP